MSATQLKESMDYIVLSMMAISAAIDDVLHTRNQRQNQ